jgi:hypothetical protein
VLKFLLNVNIATKIRVGALVLCLFGGGGGRRASVIDPVTATGLYKYFTTLHISVLVTR